MMVAALAILCLPAILAVGAAYATGLIAGDSALMAWLAVNVGLLIFAWWAGRDRPPSQAVAWDD